MLFRTRMLAALIGIGAAQSLPAQSGALDDQTEYAVITGAGIGDQHGPLLAIVLWRGAPGWASAHTPTESARIDSIYRWTRLHADEQRLNFFGSGSHYGLIDEGHRRVTLEGTSFSLAPSDSALVIMVAIQSSGGPRTITTARLSTRLPEDYWTRMWSSGDTTFIVRPRLDRLNAMLLTALRSSPAVAAFLR